MNQSKNYFNLTLSNETFENKSASEIECWAPSEYDTVAFLLDTCVTGTLMVIGVLGNLMAIVAFGTYIHKTSTTILLTALAVSDLLYLSVHALLFQVLRSVFPETGYLKSYYDIWSWIEPYEYPCGVTFQTISVWCVVLVACDRFIGVRWPFKSKRLCTNKRAKLEILFIVIVAILLNFPRFFTQKTVTEFDPCTNTTKAKLVGTDFGWNPGYIWPATILYIGFIYIIPILILAIVNISLMRELRKAATKKRSLTIIGYQKKKPEGERITFMLILVVMVFLVCQIPVGVDHILYASKLDSWPWPGRGYYSLACNTLVALNSSVNFFIYVLFGSKFRRRLWEIWCQHQWKPRASWMSTLSTRGISSAISSLHSSQKTPSGSINKEPYFTDVHL